MENTLAILLLTFTVVVLLDVMKRRTVVHAATLLGLTLAFVTAFSDPLLSLPLIANDGLSAFFAVLFIAIAFLVVTASKSETPSYYASVLLATTGMILAAGSRDILLLYVSIELVTTPAYMLVVHGKTKPCFEAATKYFVVSIVASAFLLLGVGLLAVSAGTTSLADMLPSGPLWLLGLAAALTGLGFKMGIFPFNFWIPDVYQGSSSQVAGFLAGASKKAGFAALVRILVDVPVFPSWTPVIAALAALTMTVPNLIALRQDNARRMLSYSIMTHAGFLLMGLAVLSPVSLAGLLVHAFVHGFMALGAFLVLGAFQDHGLETIDQLNGLGWKNRYLSLALTLFLLSLAGLPLLAGFMSKLYLFYAVAVDGLLWLVILALVNSGIALYYYFRIIRALYGYDPSGKPYLIHHGTTLAITLCLIVIVLLGLYPVPLFDTAATVASALF